jgi:integrase/recombinase XerD
MRAMEALGLAWDKVDLETGKIMLGQRDTKTKQLRRPKLSSRALQALHALPRHPTSPWVFCHTGGRFDGQQWPYRTVYKWYQRAVRAAGLKGVGGERVWLHSLRHTFVKDSRARGIDPRVSMLMTGHRTMSAFTRYGFINEKETEDAWDKVDRSIKSGRTARRAAGGAR